MPQMMPLNWLFLFLFFIFIFITFNALNYFIFMSPPQNKSNPNKMNSSTFNWKW